MEEHSQVNTTPSSNFLYSSNSTSKMMPANSFQLNFSNYEAHNRMIKTESSSSQHVQNSFYPYNQEFSQGEVESIKAKIVEHPQYPKLLDAFMDYQKVGAQPEVADRLVAARQEFEATKRFSGINRDRIQDPELDRFMVDYCRMLVNCGEELKRTLQETKNFMQMMESELNMLSDIAPLRMNNSDENCEDVGSSDEGRKNSEEDSEFLDTNPRAENQELKSHLLRKYGGYLNNLKQELSKKRKKGKLPKDARQKLLNWWQRHYKWPYPSEAEKTSLAESTGLDHKQINNWFINQRKRHWRPSEDMSLTVMDGFHAQPATLYMEGHYMGTNPPNRLGP